MRQGWEKRIGEMRVRSNEDFYLEVETKWGAPSGILPLILMRNRFSIWILFLCCRAYPVCPFSFDTDKELIAVN